MGRILILANNSAGLYGFRNELLIELTKEYEVYASLPDHTHDEEFEAEGIRVIDTQINRRGVNPVQDLKLLGNYLKILKEIKPDVVLTYTIKPNVYGGLACSIKKIPYLANITGLGSALENPGILQKITKMLYKIGLRSANTVFMQNQVNYDFCKANRLTKSEMVLLPGSGVNTEKFGVLPWPEEKKAFVYVSRVMKEKGIEEYIACAKAIKAEYPEVDFHILGFCEENYENELARLNEEGTIIYHGAVKDVRPYLEKVRCIIHPSFYPEGMSNVCLEAAASGRAVITTDRPGCRETVQDGVTGFVVPIQDKDSLIEAVKSFLDKSDEQQKSMGMAGREYVVSNFDRNIVVEQYMSRLKTIMSKS